MKLYLGRTLLHQVIVGTMEEFHYPMMDIGSGLLDLEPEKGESIRDVRATEKDDWTCSFTVGQNGTISIFRCKTGIIGISAYFDQPSVRVQAKIVGYGSAFLPMPRAVLYGCGVCGEAMTECFCFVADRPLFDYERAKYTGMSSAEFRRQLEGE